MRKDTDEWKTIICLWDLVPEVPPWEESGEKWGWWKNQTAPVESDQAF